MLARKLPPQGGVLVGNVHMESQRSRAPLIIAIVMLLVPVLYAGSYLALAYGQSVFIVDPKGSAAVTLSNGEQFTGHLVRYRTCDEFCDFIFWPLEKIHRKLMPGVSDNGTTWRDILNRDQVIFP
jgi:hypothetical protein